MYLQKIKTLKIDYCQKSIHFTRFDCVTVSSSTKSFKMEKKTQDLLKTKIFSQYQGQGQDFRIQGQGLNF